MSAYKTVFLYVYIYIYIYIKLKVSRYMLWRRIGERRYSSYSYLTSALDGLSGQRHASRFTPGERTPGTHWIEGWVGPRAGMDAGARRKILCPCSGSNLDRPIVQPVVTLCCLSYRGSSIYIYICIYIYIYISMTRKYVHLRHLKGFSVNTFYTFSWTFRCVRVTPCLLW
jgi:hypothetical protein